MATETGVYDRNTLDGVTFTRETLWCFEAPYSPQGGLFTGPERVRLLALRRRLTAWDLAERPRLGGPEGRA
jgi:hypothetical protein